MNETKRLAIEVRNTLNLVRSLAERHVRDARRVVWIEGVRNFIRACEAGFPVETIIYSPVLLRSPITRQLIREHDRCQIPLVPVTPEQFRSVSKGERASGIGAIVRQRWLPLKRTDPQQGLCWLVIEQIRSPGNLGTILRTAEACGAGGVIFVGPAADPFDPVAVHGSMGGLFHLPLVRTSHEQFRDWVHRRNLSLVGLSPQAERLWTQLPESSSNLLVLGEERSGLSGNLQQLCATTVRLPMVGRADSLNVAVAAGIVMYELVKRKRAD